MKLRNILLLASALPSLTYGFGIDFSSLKPSSPELQTQTYHEPKESVVAPKKSSKKKASLKKSSPKLETINCEEKALEYLKEAYPELEFQVSSVMETDGFYTTTVNLEQSRNNRKINNAFVNVNIDKRTGFIYNANLQVWGEVAYDEIDEMSEKKTQKFLKESLIGLTDELELLDNSSDDEWDNISIMKFSGNQYVINNVPFSPDHSVIAKLVMTVKKDENTAYGIHAWEFTFFYNGAYSVISYDFKNNKVINGFENRSNIKYLTYPFSKFEDYKIEEVSDLNNLYFSPNGWHKINDDISSHVTIGNNIKAIDYATKDTFSGGKNFEFVGCKNCHNVNEMYNKNVTLTTMFYIGNMLHDIYYNLGFDEKKGNFQENNFEKGGKGNDAMILRAYIDECTEEQKRKDELCDYPYPYTTASVDGIPPAIFLPKVDNMRGKGGGRVSSGVINHVLIHEYTHAVFARIGGGPNYDCGLVDATVDAAALNEGYSDFFSAALQYDKKKYVDRNTVVVLDNINSGNSVTCDSDRKYSNLRVIRDTDTSYYEGGDVWKTMLYDAFFNIIENYPSSDDYLKIYDDDSIPGNVLFLKIVLEGMKIAGCNPTFIRARNGIIHAMEKNKYTENDKKFQCLVWKAFADRGLGYNAVEPLIKEKKYLYSDNHDLPEYCHDELD